TELAALVGQWAGLLADETVRARYNQVRAQLEEGGGGRFISRVKVPGQDTVLGLALWQRRGEPGREQVDILGVVTDPSVTAGLDDGEGWRGLPRELILNVLASAEREYPGVDVAVTPVQDVVWDAARTLFFARNLSDSWVVSLDPPLAQAAHHASQRLYLRQRDALRPYVQEFQSLLDTFSGAVSPELIQRSQQVVAGLNAVFQQMDGVNEVIAGVGPRYLTLRQAFSQLVTEVTEGVAGRGDVPETTVTRLTEMAEHLTQTAPRPDPVQAGTRFAETAPSRVVVQLENSPLVTRSSELLYEKNSADSHWVRLQGNQWVTMDGGAAVLDENSRITIVGHGTSTSISGYSAEELARLLHNTGLLTGDTPIRRISLVACGVDDPQTPVEEGAPRAPFAQRLMENLDSLGVRVASVSARDALVMVDTTGRKWTGIHQADGSVLWSQKSNANKLIVERDGNGGYVTSTIPVEQGLVRTFVGNRAGALGTLDRRTVRFENGIQVDDQGNPVTGSQRLGEEQMALALTLLGGDGNGEILVDGDSITVSPPESGGGDAGLPRPLDLSVPDRVGTPGVFPDLALPGAGTKGTGMGRTPEKGSADVEVAALDQELIRLNHLQAQAVARRLNAYGELNGQQVILDLASLTREGDTIRFSVVNRSELNTDGSIPETARRINLETEVDGLGDAHVELFRRMAEVAAQQGSAPAGAWAGLVGSNRNQEAITFDAENANQPSVPFAGDHPSLERARDAVIGRFLLRRATKFVSRITREAGLGPEWVPILHTMEETESGYRITFMNRL
ncbi:MAG: C80 family cysteine peptidase, partial [Desulfobacterales bacterium]|nr:C80 family cysteine peptidase [Desulfobacterales bacterium]